MQQRFRTGGERVGACPEGTRTPVTSRRVMPPGGARRRPRRRISGATGWGPFAFPDRGCSHSTTGGTMETPRSRSWFFDLLAHVDRLLRGELARPHQEQVAGEKGRARASLLAVGILVLGAAYGPCMGLFAVFSGHPDGWLQLLATTFKVPLLFLLTLVVTFPSLYVFSALAGSPMRARATLELALAAVALNLTVLASFGPVVAFFTASTKSYVFLKLLNVLFFLVAGVVGVRFLY